MSCIIYSGNFSNKGCYPGIMRLSVANSGDNPFSSFYFVSSLACASLRFMQVVGWRSEKLQAQVSLSLAFLFKGMSFSFLNN